MVTTSERAWPLTEAGKEERDPEEEEACSRENRGKEWLLLGAEEVGSWASVVVEVAR